MSDIIKPGLPSLTLNDDGTVGATTVVVDQKMPMGQTYTAKHRIKPEELLMAMARASRDGMPMELIRKEYGIDYWTDPKTGTKHYIDDRTIENALAKGRALLDARIAVGLETAESVIEKPIDEAPLALTPDDNEEDEG
jgi:hypothetical protein